MKTQTPMPKILLGAMLRRYFCEYLVNQRDLSPRTIASYRDTFRLFLGFLERRYRIKPDVVCVDDLDAPRVLAFLDDLERRRGNTARTRNARRAAIRSFLRYSAAANPQLLSLAQRVLAIPAKRFERASVGHLTREQVQAIIDSPDTTTISGQRDQILLVLLYNTGARVSELAGLQIQDVSLDSRMSVHIHGKGRKERKRCQEPLFFCFGRPIPMQYQTSLPTSINGF
jgi:site-specific recombinase XerD